MHDCTSSSIDINFYIKGNPFLLEKFEIKKKTNSKILKKDYVNKCDIETWPKPNTLDEQ